VRLFFVLIFLINLLSAEIKGQSVDSLILQAKKLRYDNKYDSAIFLLQSIISSSEVNATNEQLSKIYNNLAISYGRIDNKKELLKYYYEAINHNIATENKEELTKNYINLGSYYEGESELSKAYFYLTKAKETAPNQIKYNAFITLSLASIFQNSKDSVFNSYDSAIFYSLAALNYFSRLRDSTNIANVYNNLGVLYEKEKNPIAAENNYRKSLSINEKLNRYRMVALTNYNLGNIYLKQQRFEESKARYEKSLELKDYVKPRLRMNIYSNLVKAKMGLGEVDEASLLFQKYNELRDSVFDTQTMQEVKDLETKYETALKDQEIAIQQKKIEKENLQKNIYLISSLLLITLMITSIIFFRQKQRYLRRLRNEEIANLKTEQELKELNAMMHGQEEERNRIASDLHDRLGARLSSIKLLCQNDADQPSRQDKVLNFIDEAIKETREISHNLSTDMLSRFGIQTALKDTVRSINDTSRIEASLTILGIKERWPLEIERNIYYVLLELINNTIKHAEAGSIMVQLSQVENEINIFYEDDGKGFEMKERNTKGMGLRSMQARMSAINGTIDTNSKPGKGFSAVMSVSLPYKSLPINKSQAAVNTL